MNDFLSFLFTVGIGIIPWIIARELEKRHEKEVEDFLNGTDE